MTNLVIKYFGKEFLESTEYKGIKSISLQLNCQFKIGGLWQKCIFSQFVIKRVTFLVVYCILRNLKHVFL